MINVIEGHLTTTEKKAINTILENNLMEGKIGRKTYFLKLNDGIYTVKVCQWDRGLIPCPGSALRESITTHKFEII